MAKTAKEVMQFIREQGIKMVDFKMVDINGQYRHVTIPAQNFTESTMTDGIGFDASNYGYAVVEKSDMVFIPDPDTMQIDPFCEIPTLSMTGNAMIIDYPKNRPLDQYPRNIVLAAEQYMKDSGVADTMLILPEFEFYLFDDVTWKVAPNEIGMSLDAEQAHWNGDINGRGVIVPKQAHYHIAKPLDRTYECRSEMCLLMEEAGIPIKYHHPEVGGAGQFEIEPKLGQIQDGGRDDAHQVHHPQHRPQIRQERDLHAQARLRRGRQRHARAYAADEGRQPGILRRQRLLALKPRGTLVHRRIAEAYLVPLRDHEPVHQLLQASGAGL